MTREMVCPYCKHRIYTDAPDPIYCGPHRASVGPNEYPRVQMAEAKKERESAMTEMIERVAKALCREAGVDESAWRGYGDSAAIAAIEAMRPRWFGDLPEAAALAGEETHDAPSMLERLKTIQQRLNESGTGEMGVVDTIHAVHALVVDAIKALTASERGK